MYMMHLKVLIIFIVDIMVLETMSYMPVFHFSGPQISFTICCRLTPPYMLFMMFNSCLVRYLYDGPQWTIGDDDKCLTYWWRNLLYINNLFPAKDLVCRNNFMHMYQKCFSCTPDRNCHTFCLGDKIASHPGVLTQAKCAKKLRKTLK